MKTEQTRKGAFCSIEGCRAVTQALPGMIYTDPGRKVVFCKSGPWRWQPDLLSKCYSITYVSLHSWQASPKQDQTCLKSPHQKGWYTVPSLSNVMMCFCPPSHTLWKSRFFNQLKSQTKQNYWFLIPRRIQRKDLTESRCDTISHKPGVEQEGFESKHKSHLS